MNESIPERPYRPGIHRFKVLARHLPRAQAGAAWLDLGGGAGEFSVLADDHGFRVTLVDGDPRNVANAKSRGMAAALADLNAPLTFLDDASFDGVSLLEVVEHIPQAEGLMDEAFRLLKPGGLLLLSTPNAFWWQERFRVLFGRTLSEDAYHYRFFTVSATRRLCERAGFAIERMEFSSPAFGYNWFKRSLLKGSERVHVRIPGAFARLLAQTVYVVGRRP
jgi:SAM-dependent methyltransferase